MAFGFKFGGDKGPVAKLVAGKLRDDEKQQLLAQLSQASPSAEELVPLVCNEDPAINSRVAQLFLAKADAGAVNALVEDVLGRTAGFAIGVKVLQKCREELVTRAVEPYLAQPRPDLARKLWELLFDLAPTVSEKYLVRAMAEAPGPQRVLALKRLLKQRGADGAKPLLLEAVTNRESAVRKEAITVLAGMSGEDIFSVMLDRLSNDDSREVCDAAGKYLQQYISKAPPEVRPRVLGRLLLAGEPEQRKALVQSMFSQGKPDELLLGVLNYCKTITGVQHRIIMEALKSVGDPLIAPALALLKGTDTDLRVQAIYLLEAYADPRTIGSLLQMLRDPDWWVRIVVCEALGRTKEPKVIGPLREVFTDADAKWAAIDAVGVIGGDPATTALLPLLGDPSTEVRAAVIATLRHIKDPRVETALTDASTKDPSVDNRLKAVEVLREMKGDGRGASGAVVSSKDLTKPMEKMLAFVREQGGSDLHVTPGEPPLMRLNGVLERVQAAKLEPDAAKAALRELLDPVRLPILDEKGAVDFCYAIPGVGRYRANVFSMKRGLAGVFRVIPNRPPTFAELGLPKHLSDIGTYHQGIVLVTGPAGSGKTTTMTALLNTLNETRSAHVLTFEDPVEFIHTSKKALINQREIGKDSMSYAAAMRAALREDPDIVVVGDMRDPETIRLALLASETGHLVIATMQTTGAVATIDKVVESFPPDEQAQVRGGLAESFKLIVSQILVPRADGKGRVGVFEVLKSTSSVRSLIRDNKVLQLPSTMTISRNAGMQTIDGALEERVRAGHITYDVALQFAQNKDQFAKLRTALQSFTPAAAAAPAAPGAAAPGVAVPGTRPSAPGAPAAAGGPGAAAGGPGMRPRPSAPVPPPGASPPGGPQRPAPPSAARPPPPGPLKKP